MGADGTKKRPVGGYTTDETWCGISDPSRDVAEVVPVLTSTEEFVTRSADSQEGPRRPDVVLQVGAS
jgi:hypothetical protein